MMRKCLNGSRESLSFTMNINRYHQYMLYIQYKSILSLMLLPCNFLMAFHFTIIQFVYVDLIEVDFPLGRFVCIIPIQVSFAFSTFVLILILNDWFCFFISFIFFKCHFDDLILEKKRLCNLNTRKPSM